MPSFSLVQTVAFLIKIVSCAGIFSFPKPAKGNVIFASGFNVSVFFLVSAVAVIGPTKDAVQVFLLPAGSVPIPDQLAPTIAPPSLICSAPLPFLFGKEILTKDSLIVIFAVKVSLPIIEADKSFLTSKL